MAAVAAINNFHSSIQTLAQTKRIRVTEFFQDFDKLRSGFVTAPQFSRCLWQTLGLQLTPEQEALISQKYDIKNDGQINYKLFCDEIDRGFNAKDLRRNPEAQRSEAPEFLGTIRTVRPMSPSSERRLVQLLSRIEQFYQYHGINLRTCYEDFDRHHIGVVTESQFFRNFPGPPDVNESEKTLLVSKYRDPDRPGLLNYLNLHHDIVAIGAQVAMDKELIVSPNTKVDNTHVLVTADPALNIIFDKIRVAVFKNGIRTTEFFKDHDKLRSGIITENQFVCGLSLAVGKEAQLSRAEIQKVVEYYRQPDSRVQYKEFCDMMENAFTIPDLEKKPLQNATRPVKGALSRGLKGLTAAEEGRLQEILCKISDNVRRRRLMMYPYFKDYDRGKAYTRVVTPTQFGRILHFLSLNVAPEDLKLLLRKFEDPATGDVNYPAFVQAVDQEFVGHTMDDADLSWKGRTNTPVKERPVSASESNVSYENLMLRIRHIVLTNRLRVAEFFEDYDPLRCGSISKTQFRRGLGQLGLSKLGQHDLQEAQFKILCDVYENPQKEDQALWTKFLWDIETVFTQPGLEKVPDLKVPPQEIFRVPKPGTIDWSNASADHKDLFNKTMDRLRQRTEQRRVLAKPNFQDFDRVENSAGSVLHCFQRSSVIGAGKRVSMKQRVKGLRQYMYQYTDRHNNGHVTQSQFRQCLTMLELHCTEPEMIALEAKFCNDVGFNYLAFLSELQPVEPPTFMYETRLEEIRQTNVRKTLPELNAQKDLEGIMLKIKTKVSRERIRVLEFMRDYDKLRSGRMLKPSFRRALDLCRFELRESEMSILEDRYQSSQDSEYVEYLKFCDEVESIFTTKELEKTPLEDVVQFRAPEEWEMNKLESEQQSKFIACMDRLCEKVRKHRMQLFPLFEDYDRVHNGTVSRSQFRRVLTELELSSLVSHQDFELLWQQFDVKIGGKDDVNYIAFCDMIYNLANFDSRKP